MNVPTDIAKQAIEAMKGSPVLLLVLILNITAFAGFGYTLHSVSAAMERREALLRDCITK